MNNFDIGLAMIVKDNKNTIGDAINSTAGLFKQVVIVDTGSKDNTPSICCRLGAEVHFHRWCDDFSDVRNYSLKFIKTKWVLILDSDEILDTSSFLKEQNLLNNENCGGLKINIHNYLDDNNTKSVHSYTRIFRKHPNILFKGKIHEQINESIINAGYDIIDSNIIIEHYGYKNQTEEKFLRNKQLLKQELSEKPADSWLHYHLGETEFAAGNLLEAQRFFTSVLNSPTLSIEQIEITKLRLGQISLKNEKFLDLENYLNFNSENVNREGLRLYIKAAALLLQGNLNEAFVLYNSKEVYLSQLVDTVQVRQAMDVIQKLLSNKS
jgi:glycosyltransferase involved in cell wall biosynthesis